MKIVNKCLNITLTIILVLMIIMVTIQVLNRYIFELALPWTEEMSRYLYIWLTFFGAILVTRDKEHIEVDFLLKKFKPKMKKIIKKINSILILLFLLTFIYGSIISVTHSLGSKAPTLTFVDKGVVMMVLPLSGVVMFTIYTIRLFARKEN